MRTRMAVDLNLHEPPPLDVMLTTADVASTIGAHIFETLYAYDASFVARTTSFQIEEMAGIITEAIRHPGFAVVHILSPCVTYPVLSWKGLRERFRPIPEAHPATDKAAALRLAYSAEPLYMGIFYSVRKPTLEARMSSLSRSALERYSSNGRPPTIPSLMERYL